MPVIRLVTYMRKGEQFTTELVEIADMLYEIFGVGFGVVLCCESPITIRVTKPYPIQQRLCNGTKYLRLSSLLEDDTSDYFLSVDNDIRGNMEALRSFAIKAKDEDLDVAWGKIRAKKHKGIFSELVAVDKLLSHNILRPALWKLGVGISIPGQCFWIKRETFAGKLPKIDTFLDDLSVGLEVSRRQDNLKMRIFPTVLGYETPNETFSGLWRQRGRWAKGYASVLTGVNTKKDRNKVIIHGLTYHALWIFSWLICFLLTRINRRWAVSYLSLVSLIIASENKFSFRYPWRLLTTVRKIVYAIIYQIIFPIFHIRWFVVMLYSLLKN